MAAFFFAVIWTNVAMMGQDAPRMRPCSPLERPKSGGLGHNAARFETAPVASPA